MRRLKRTSVISDLTIKNKLADALNKAAIIFLSQEHDSIEETMTEGIGKIAEAAKLDRVSLWRSFTMPDGEHVSQIYRWDRVSGGTIAPDPAFRDMNYSKVVPDWLAHFLNNTPINGPASKISGGEVLQAFGVVSVFVQPVFIKGKFWGAAMFEDRRHAYYFDEAHMDMLRSAAFLCVNTVIRKEAGRKLIEDEAGKKSREAEKSVQLMFNSMPLCSWIWLDDLTILDCNQETIDLFGLAGKLTTADLFETLTPEYQPDGENSKEVGYRYIEEAFTHGYKRFEFLHQTVGGEPMPCEITLVRTEYNGKTVVLSYARDLCEQKKMLAEIYKESQLSKQMAHWYESILDSIPFYLSVQDEDTNWVFLNSALEIYIGKTRKELLGVPCSEWNNPICGTDNCAIDCVKRGVNTTHFHDGMLSYQVNVNRLTDINGDPAGFVEIIQDITETELMSKKKAEAEAASHAKTNFLSHMSHEIRTPLNAIVGMTTIGKNANDIERKDRAFTKIEDASAHLLGVVNDILDISKIEADMFKLSPVEYDFERMIHKVVSVMNYRLNEKRLQFTLHIDGKTPRFIVGDDQRLAQVLMNLLSNAIKFTPETGKVDLDISVIGNEDECCELRVAVTDTGIGISDEQKEKLFVAFSQAESGISREYGGTGLGLVISKRIVELMGGDLRVESALGAGSKFIFTIKAALGRKTIRNLLTPDVNWKMVRILAVDDAEETREYFIDLFRRLDVSCDAAADGYEALRLFQENGGYDICFIDWRMPGMDGIELAKRIQEQGGGKASIAVMISGFDVDDVREHACEAGVHKFLEKPLMSADILDCVNECLGVEPDDAEECDDTEGMFTGKHILLAEDVEINKEIVTALLEDTGLAIDCAENGNEALAMVASAPDKYDLILMDIHMPQMDGLEATRRIRALPSHCCANIPIIAMTADVFKDDIDKCIAAGMNEHVGKPLNVDELYGKLQKYLGCN